MSESIQEVRPSGQYDRDSLYYRHERDDEIDLVELFMKIWNRKWWVILAGTLTTGIALAYALLATPVYKVYAELSPPSSTDLSALLDSGVDLTKFNPFETFVQTLDAPENKLKIFDQNITEILAIYDSGNVDQSSEEDLNAFFDDFEKSLSINLPSNPKNGAMIVDNRVEIAIEISDKNLGKKIISQLIENALLVSVDAVTSGLDANRRLSIERLKNQIDDQIKLERENRTLRIGKMTYERELALALKQDQIDVLRSELEREREGEVMALQQAMGIAKKLGIVKSPLLNSDVELANMNASTSNTTGFSNAAAPLYLRGVEFLQAELDAMIKDQDFEKTSEVLRKMISELAIIEKDREISALSNIADDSPFIYEILSPISEEIYAMESFDDTYPNLKFARISKYPSLPKSPIKPKKTLIVLLGSVLGGMLGVFIALVVPARKETVSA